MAGTSSIDWPRPADFQRASSEDAEVIPLGTLAGQRPAHTIALREIVHRWEAHLDRISVQEAGFLRVTGTYLQNFSAGLQLALSQTELALRAWQWLAWALEDPAAALDDLSPPDALPALQLSRDALQSLKDHPATLRIPSPVRQRPATRSVREIKDAWISRWQTAEGALTGPALAAALVARRERWQQPLTAAERRHRQWLKLYELLREAEAASIAWVTEAPSDPRLNQTKREPGRSYAVDLDSHDFGPETTLALLTSGAVMGDSAHDYPAGASEILCAQYPEMIVVRYLLESVLVPSTQTALDHPALSGLPWRVLLEYVRRQVACLPMSTRRIGEPMLTLLSVRMEELHVTLGKTVVDVLDAAACDPTTRSLAQLRHPERRRAWPSGWGTLGGTDAEARHFMVALKEARTEVLEAWKTSLDLGSRLTRALAEAEPLLLTKNLVDTRTRLANAAELKALIKWTETVGAAERSTVSEVRFAAEKAVALQQGAHARPGRRRKEEAE